MTYVKIQINQIKTSTTCNTNPAEALMSPEQTEELKFNRGKRTLSSQNIKTTDSLTVSSPPQQTNHKENGLLYILKTLIVLNNYKSAL